MTSTPEYHFDQPNTAQGRKRPKRTTRQRLFASDDDMVMAAYTHYRGMDGKCWMDAPTHLLYSSRFDLDRSNPIHSRRSKMTSCLRI
jgi:hypothetical protein